MRVLSLSINPSAMAPGAGTLMAPRPLPVMSFPGLPTRRQLSAFAAVVVAHTAVLWGILQFTELPQPEPLPMADTVTAVWLTPEAAPQPAQPHAPAPHLATRATSQPQPTKASTPVSTPVLTPAPAQVPVAVAAPLPSPAASPAVAGAPANNLPHTGTSDAAPAATANAHAAAATPTKAAAVPTLELPSSSADYLHNPKPPYPPMSRRLNEQGVVELRVYINTDGSAGNAEIRHSSGYDRLDRAALQAALSWRYKPGKRNGVPEAMWANVPITFNLE